MTRRDYEELAEAVARALYVANKDESEGVLITQRMIEEHISAYNKGFDKELFNDKVQGYLKDLND